MPSQERRGDVGASIWTVFEKERSELNYKSCREEYQIKKVFCCFCVCVLQTRIFLYFLLLCKVEEGDERQGSGDNIEWKYL